MSPRAVVRWATGAYGSRVSVMERAQGTLALRYTSDGKVVWRALGHRDLAQAKHQARALAKALAGARALAADVPAASRTLTVGQLFARYEAAVSAVRKGTGPAEHRRRARVWRHVLGATTLARRVGVADVEAFVAARRAGTLVVPGVALRTGAVTPRTVQADVEWLRGVWAWGERVGLLTANPIRHARAPEVRSQLRPMATPARAAALLAVAADVHPRLPLFLACVRWLGWRVSAVCALDGTDLDRTPVVPHAPDGRIRKRRETDKEGAGGWLPLGKALRAAFDAAGVLPVPGPVFEAPRSRGRPWSRYYARDLLERAEALAKLPALEGGDWHPYRRLWATERKHLPAGDVALAGDWKDRRSVERYTLTDPATVAKVMRYEPPPLPAPPTEPETTTETAGAEGAPRRAHGTAD